MCARKWRRVCAGLMSAGLLIAGDVAGQPARLLDHEAKAAYLLNFGRFATWPSREPAASSRSFVMCVIGRDPFGPTLDDIVTGETIGGRPVAARRLTRSEDAAACQVLFISESELARVKPILDVVGGAPTLTVSDMPEFVERGGMIQFVRDGNRLRFAVNVAATERAGLMLSSELLRVAVTVKAAGRPNS